jgi:hypothetical protein
MLKTAMKMKVPGLEFEARKRRTVNSERENLDEQERTVKGERENIGLVFFPDLFNFFFFPFWYFPSFSRQTN